MDAVAGAFHVALTRLTLPSSMPTSMKEDAVTSDQCIPNGIW